MYLPFLVNLTKKIATPFEFVETLYVFLFIVNLTRAFLTNLFLFLSVTVTFLTRELALNVLYDAVIFGVALLTITLDVWIDAL